MAACVTLNPDGTLSPTGQPVDECAGFVMVSGAEYGVYTVVHDAFATPTHEETAQLFSLGFFGVVCLYMVGRIGGSIASFFDRA